MGVGYPPYAGKLSVQYHMRFRVRGRVKVPVNDFAAPVTAARGIAVYQTYCAVNKQANNFGRGMVYTGLALPRSRNPCGNRDGLGLFPGVGTFPDKRLVVHGVGSKGNGHERDWF